MAKKYYVQYGGRPPSWILKIIIFGHVTYVPHYQNTGDFRWDMAI